MEDNNITKEIELENRKSRKELEKINKKLKILIYWFIGLPIIVTFLYLLLKNERML